jgi:hypothetical protein
MSSIRIAAALVLVWTLIQLSSAGLPETLTGTIRFDNGTFIPDGSILIAKNESGQTSGYVEIINGTYLISLNAVDENLISFYVDGNPSNGMTPFISGYNATLDIIIVLPTPVPTTVPTTVPPTTVPTTVPPTPTPNSNAGLLERISISFSDASPNDILIIGLVASVGAGAVVSLIIYYFVFMHKKKQDVEDYVDSIKKESRRSMRK